MAWDLQYTGTTDPAKQIEFAKEDFNKFSTTEDVRDPILLTGHVMAAFSQEEANLLKTLLKRVTLGTDHVSRVNKLMQLLNKALGDAAEAKKKDEDSCNVGVGTEAEMNALRDRFLAEGCDAADFTVKQDGSKWALAVIKGNLTIANTHLSNVTDDLSSTQSKDQTQLQTIMGRYNNAIELVTATIKKNEGEGEAMNANLK